MFGGSLNVFGGTFLVFDGVWRCSVIKSVFLPPNTVKHHRKRGVVIPCHECPTFDPSPEILILSVSGFTWYLMYRIISLSRLTYAPRIFPGIFSKWYKLLISSRHWENKYFRGSPSQNIVLSFFFRQILVWRFAEDLLDDGLKSTLTVCPSNIFYDDDGWLKLFVMYYICQL